MKLLSRAGKILTLRKHDGRFLVIVLVSLHESHKISLAPSGRMHVRNILYACIIIFKMKKKGNKPYSSLLLQTWLAKRKVLLHEKKHILKYYDYIDIVIVQFT
jgi:hypothetical protein